MSKYTTQLRFIVEQTMRFYETPAGQRYPNEVYAKLGLLHYPIFDEAHRTILNDKIIDHYYFEEIGFETTALFAWNMGRKMNEIMPYYNQLYMSELLEFDPLTNYGRTVKETWDEARNSVTDTESSTDSGTLTTTGTDTTDDSRNIYQDTPMSLLSNAGSPSVENLDYATNVTYDNATGTVDTVTDGETSSATDTLSNTDSTGEGKRDKVETGYAGKSPSLLLAEYRATILNIDMMIIEELQRMFMGVW